VEVGILGIFQNDLWRVSDGDSANAIPLKAFPVAGV